MPRPEEHTTVLTKEEIIEERNYDVIIFNDDFHNFDEVIFQLQKATGCSLEMAEHIANTAHGEGEADAFTGTKEKCEAVADILQLIDLRVEIRPGV